MSRVCTPGTLVELARRQDSDGYGRQWWWSVRGPATEGCNRGAIGRRSGFVVRVRAPDDVVRGCCMPRSERRFGRRRPWLGRSSYRRWCRFGRRRWGGDGGVVVCNDNRVTVVGDECEVLRSVGGGRRVLWSVGGLLGLSECFSGNSLRGGQNDVTGGWYQGCSPY